MQTTTRLLLYIALVCAAAVATAQPNSQQSRVFQNANTEQYEGTATAANQEEIAVTISLAENDGALSGEIISSQGTFAITGGARRGDTITIQFDVNGETGTLTGKLEGDRILGTYKVADQTGSVDVRRTKATESSAAAPIATPILILGVYHMDDSALDDGHKQADDLLSAKRQQELEELVGNLARFRPTKIAIEASYGDAYWPDEYRKYLSGQHMRGKNEIEQIGFRLARRLNLPTLYPIDLPIMANGETPSKAQIAPAKTAAEATASPDALSPEEKLLRQSTVTEYLTHLNSPAQIRKGQDGYMNNLLPVSGPEIYQNADLVANWYKRNLRIFANINRVTDPGKDRILVIIGVGHLKLLHDFAADAPYFDLVDAESFLQ